MIKIIKSIKTKISMFNRKHYIMSNQIKQLKNRDFSLIASTCNGGIISHDLHLRFNSPTINLFMLPSHYVKFCSKLKYYLNCEIKEIKIENISYPVGIVDNEIIIHFMHYKTFHEAKEKWIERSKRVNYDNLFFIMTDRDGCSVKDIEDFDKLPYRNKVIFCSKNYEQFESAVFCEEFEKNESVGILTEFRNIKGERLYDKYFNFVDWFNESSYIEN